MLEFINLLIKSNTINFLIVAGLLVFACIKLNVKGKLENKAEEIKSYVETAQKEKEEAQKKLDFINGKIDKLPYVTARIDKSTENSIKSFENKVQRDIAAEKEDINSNANRIFKLETAKFKDRLGNLLSQKSVDLAKQNAIEQLKKNPELSDYYINKAIDELDEVNL